MLRTPLCELFGIEVVSTHQVGRQHDTLLTAGQTAGGITEILPVAEIMRSLIAEAEAALSQQTWKS